MHYNISHLSSLIFFQKGNTLSNTINSAICLSGNYDQLKPSLSKYENNYKKVSSGALSNNSPAILAIRSCCT